MTTDDKIIALFSRLVVGPLLVWWAWCVIGVSVFNLPPLNFWQALLGSMAIRAIILPNIASNNK